MGRAAAGLALLLASVSLLRAAEWYVDYDKGRRALEAGNFSEAVALLESALQSRKEPGNRVRTYGMNFTAYYPYFYLGKAYLGTGDRSKAREMFEESERRGELSRESTLARDLSQELQGLRGGGASPGTGAGEKVAEKEAPAKPGLSASEQKRLDEGLAAVDRLLKEGKPGDAQARLADLLKGLPPAGQVPEADPYRRRLLDLQSRAGEATEAQAASARAADFVRSLEAARVALREGDFASARQEFARAQRLDPQREELAALGRDLQAAESRNAERQASARLVAEAEQLMRQSRFDRARDKFGDALAREPANKEAAEGVKRATDALAASLSEGEKLRRVSEDVRAARELLGRAQVRLAVEKWRAAESLDPAGAQVSSLARDLVAAARGKARQGVALHFRGEHEKAMTEIEDALPALSGQAHAHLYLGLACLSRFFMDGEEDKELERKAERAIAEAMRLDRQVKVDPRVVSPRLVAAVERIRNR